MKVQTTPIPGLLIIQPNVFGDSRGYFFEAYNEPVYREAGICQKFIQDNVSLSCKNTIRGLHYQLAPFAQAKLVEVLKGRVLDVAVDLRQNSPTYGQHYAVELSDENHYQYFIPRGFAHGFSVLSDEATFHYKCDNPYNKESERGLNFNDPTLQIDWKIPVEKIVMSPKDEVLPGFNEADMNFFFAED
jgi:dTDP-4-dehydrorhamnose 3,5-epimerase